MSDKVVKSIGFASRTLSSVGGGNPYIAALTTVVDIGMKVAQRRQDTVNDQVDVSANDFERVSVTFEAASTDTRVEHKLGRVPQGFQVESRSTEVQVWQTAADERFITLQAVNGTFPTTVSVKVY